MTEGQKESMYLIYVNVCNAFMYAEDLSKDDTLNPTPRRSIKVIRDRLKWIKTAIELKTEGDILKQIDTLRYDELFRVMSHLDLEHEEAIEKMIIEYVKQIK